MKRDKTAQANYRLPESLLRDLKEVAEVRNLSQTLIVKQGVEARIRQLKAVIERQQKTGSASA